MKRGGPLPRRTPLKAKTEIPRATTQIRQKAPAKPGVVSAERAAKKAVRERSNNLCEARIDGACDGKGLDFSHRIAKGQGGPWLPSNGLRLCRQCHSWCHAHPELAKLWMWQLPAVSRVVDGNRTLVPAASFPAYIWRPDAWQAEWYWLRDDGSAVLVDYFDLPATAGGLVLPDEGGAAA